MSEYEYDQPTHDEPTADYPPADQYDSLIGQPLDGGIDAPHHEQSVGGFTANDGYGPEHVSYEGADQPAEYSGEPAPDYAGAEGYAGEQPAGYEGGQPAEGYTGGEGYAGAEGAEPNYAADAGEYAQPTQGTSTSGTSAQ